MKFRAIENNNRLIKIISELSDEDGKYICRVIHRDHLADISLKLLIIYVFILGGFLLWPFDFLYSVKNDARWIGNSDGIEFVKMGQAASNSSAKKIFDRLVNGKGYLMKGRGVAGPAPPCARSFS